MPLCVYGYGVFAALITFYECATSKLEALWRHERGYFAAQHEILSCAASSGMR